MMMGYYLNLLAVLIGYWYSRKYGREAIAKINEFNAEKENHKANNT